MADKYLVSVVADLRLLDTGQSNQEKKRLDAELYDKLSYS